MLRTTSSARRLVSRARIATPVPPRRAACTASAAAGRRRDDSSSSSSQPPPPPPISKKSVLFLSTVWPEPHSSAAGARTTALLRAFARAGYSLSVGASAARNAASEALERGGSFCRTTPVSCFSVPLNRSSDLDAALSSSQPTVVVFDRFTSEEAFSWRVKEKVPEAARVLDMQDWHSLRRARARSVELADEKNSSSSSSSSSSSPKQQNPVSAALASRIDASDRDAVREASAIYRSDLTLVCSPVEERLLRQSLMLGSDGDDDGGKQQQQGKLVPAPLLASRPALRSTRRRSFERRRHFVAIGSFLHAPNVDSLLWLAGRRRSDKKRKKRKEKASDGESEENENDEDETFSNSTPIWDLITSKLGMEDAELHIYGSYASKCTTAAEIHDPKRRVFVHGPAPNLSPLSRARVLLAPLRYGAGLKGKIADSWMRGTPVVTTPIGAEGMEEEMGLNKKGEGEGEGRKEGEEVEEGRRSGESLFHLSPWGGSRTSMTSHSFASEAVRLYLDEKAWTRASEEGSRLHDALYFTSKPADAAVAAVDALFSPNSSSSSSLLSARRKRDFVGASLWADSARATEYFSRWIELKEKEKEKEL